MAKSWLLFSLLICLFTNGEALDDKYTGVKSINPIMRYWAQSRLRRKLPILEALAAKSRQEGSEKYRNCFFSPVQCQLPVVIKADPLVSALQVENREPTTYVRFRRLP